MQTPRKLAGKLDKVINAWKTLRPEKSIAGMTLAEFQAKAQPSLDVRNQIVTLRDQTTDSRTRRANSDRVTNDLLLLVVNAVKGDPQEGEDSPLYAAMGYVPKSSRRSGLSRKTNSAPPAQAAAVK